MSTNSVTPGLTVQRSGPFLVLPGPTDLLGHLRVARMESADEVCTDLVRKEVSLFGFADELFGASRPVLWAGLESALRGLFKSHGITLDTTPAPHTPANANGVTTGNTGSDSTADTAATGTNTSAAASPDAGRTIVLASANTGVCSATRMTDPAVVSFATGVPLGLVRYGLNVDVLRMIAELCVAFANKHVLVIVRTQVAAGRLRMLLRELGVDADVITRARSGEPGGVTVGTLGAAGWAGIERADVILVADAIHGTWIDPLNEPPIPHEIFLQQYPSNSTGRPPRMPPAVGLLDRLRKIKTSAKVIGFLPRNRALSPFEQGRVWQIYGSSELVVPRHGAVERPVITVVTNRINLRRWIPSGADEAGVKKILWHDSLRNRLRTKLARVLKEGNRHLLMTFSGMLTALTDVTPKAVLLLCEGIDQGKAIRNWFRDWPLVSGLNDSARDVEAAVANPAGGVIATAVGAEQLSGGKFDVVVRCDTGHGLPPLPPGWLETDELASRPLLVADVADEGHRLSELWSRLRQRAYLAAGWARAGADPDETAWARFEANVLGREEWP